MESRCALPSPGASCPDICVCRCDVTGQGGVSSSALVTYDAQIRSVYLPRNHWVMLFSRTRRGGCVRLTTSTWYPHPSPSQPCPVALMQIPFLPDSEDLWGWAPPCLLGWTGIALAISCMQWPLWKGWVNAAYLSPWVLLGYQFALCKTRVN